MHIPDVPDCSSQSIRNSAVNNGLSQHGNTDEEDSCRAMNDAKHARNGVRCELVAALMRRLVGTHVAILTLVRPGHLLAIFGPAAPDDLVLHEHVYAQTFQQSECRPIPGPFLVLFVIRSYVRDVWEPLHTPRVSPQHGKHFVSPANWPGKGHISCLTLSGTRSSGKKACPQRQFLCCVRGVNSITMILERMSEVTDC